MVIDHSPVRQQQRQNVQVDSPNSPVLPNREANMTEQAGNIVFNQEQALEIFQTRKPKIAPFWKSSPKLWFGQVEAAFGLARITSDMTKYQYVITNLDPETLPFISDIMERLPDQGKYEVIKERLISQFDETNESKLRRILRGAEFADDKPSNMLQRMRNLAGTEVGDNILRTLFLEQLPEHVRGILAISEVVDLSKLALQADKIMEVSRPSILAIDNNGNACASTSSKSKTSPMNTEDLSTQIAILTKNFDELNRYVRRDRARSRSRSRNSQQSNNNNDGFCFYHSRFGEKARKCRQPCNFKSNSQPLN
ncbi:uncharacterized protein [Chelonus insularis]|uniref:uncharacterized protein n=1 Tax=Chelonus insularis TaxID=460826 RepID=UPI00158B18B2|nr:uncharacterized protein LOC118064778 [Chelonus insularis]XP_034937009.1 uncharacterized protein LOC118065682 [Chelonus insularis]XP_034941486.1 uncharacterized protein LOC118068296 [Chelonus insularis]XP_034945423.1 uncharacterized protein LOC118070747 [Chelonus insularis]